MIKGEHAGYWSAKKPMIFLASILLALNGALLYFLFRIINYITINNRLIGEQSVYSEQTELLNQFKEIGVYAGLILFVIFLLAYFCINLLADRTGKSQSLEKEESREMIIKIIELISNVDPAQSLERFMETILNAIISIIPGADAGSIGILIDDRFKYLALKGFSKVLKEVDFPRDVIFLCEEPTIFYDMDKTFHFNMPEEYIAIFKQAGTSKIKCSLAMGLKTDQIIGNIFIDSFKSNAAFTDRDKKIITAVSRIISLYTYLKISLGRLDETYLGIIKALSETVEIKDRYTRGHSERVAAYALKLADLLDFSEARKHRLKESALLHDIGKIGVSDRILNKAAQLSEPEYEQIKMHTVLGGRVLKNVDNLQEVSQIVLHHHERWDGTGYPYGLKGEEIPLEARIIAIFDAFDTILTRRAYKQECTFDTALAEIEVNAGSQFDPHLVELFLAEVRIDWLTGVNNNYSSA